MLTVTTQARIPAPVSQSWDSLTQPSLIRNWFADADFKRGLGRLFEPARQVYRDGKIYAIPLERDNQCGRGAREPYRKRETARVTHVGWADLPETQQSLNAFGMRACGAAACERWRTAIGVLEHAFLIGEMR